VELLGLVSVWAAIVLVPLAVKPVIIGVVVEAVHAKVGEPALAVRVTNVVFAAEQMVWLKGLFVITGVGFTVIT
jgi:hypothetical protein